ncbi:MAG: Selenide,water dikinase [Myxococcaceae bacterium]|nr:Selenide,water dikinase [Myxococcaceae bacterium]
MLRGLALPVDPNVLVGLNPADDAAVVRLLPELALVFTTDFFTPLVDDPRTFGRIAAANALSDVYAMGGKPLVALNIMAFPTKVLGLDVMAAVLAGGADIAREAGISIAGGHSVEDKEPKYGLAVIGTVHPDRVWRKGGARAGDALVLTKALGTGVLATALKRGLIAEDGEAMRAAIASMVTLNAAAARAVVELGVEVHAATDVTGYGLVGHLGEMLRASEGVSATLSAAALPVLAGARELAADGVLAGGTKANRSFAAEWFAVADGVDDALAWIACDAQTSGGLLVACPPPHAAALVAALAAEGSPAAVVGMVTDQPGATITLGR